MRVIVSVLFCAMVASAFLTELRVCAAEIAPADFLARGISLYERNDFAGAEQYLLRAVNGEHKSVAVAHYYLANALMRTRKTNAALDEYERSYRLSPFSSFSGYCRMMLLRHGRNPDGEPGGKAGPGAGSSKGGDALKKTAPDNQEKALKDQEREKQAAAEAKPAVDPELARLTGRLPRLVAILKESPPASDIMAGALTYRSGFVGEAEQRKARAFERLEQSRLNLTRAESITHSFVPSVKSFGEGDEEFRNRRAQAEKTVSGLLDPFRENVKEAESAFQTESALLDNCINASRGFQY